MPKQQDKRKSSKSSLSENNGHDTSSPVRGITALINSFSKSAGGSGSRSSRASSAASTQPVVTNLIKIYTEATAPKHRDSSAVSTGKNDELTKNFEQATDHSQRPSKAREEAYEEITWDNLVHG